MNERKGATKKKSDKEKEGERTKERKKQQKWHSLTIDTVREITTIIKKTTTTKKKNVDEHFGNDKM